MPTSRFARGYEAAIVIAAEFDIQLHELRWFASQHLQDDDWPEGEGIGSSDISIHLAELALGQPELLREQAALICEQAALICDRDELVARVAASTGRTEAETLERLRQLMSPPLPGVCLEQAHYGMIAPRNHADPDGPSDWEGICGKPTANPSGICDEHERDWRENFPGRDLPRVEVPEWLTLGES
jgi:hypothetical protein